MTNTVVSQHQFITCNNALESAENAEQNDSKYISMFHIPAYSI